MDNRIRTVPPELSLFDSIVQNKIGGTPDPGITAFQLPPLSAYARREKDKSDFGEIIFFITQTNRFVKTFSSDFLFWGEKILPEMPKSPGIYFSGRDKGSPRALPLCQKARLRNGKNEIPIPGPFRKARAFRSETTRTVQDARQISAATRPGSLRPWDGWDRSYISDRAHRKCRSSLRRSRDR